MSYILEALRRAENERERKRRVPGLHTQPVPAPATEDSRPGGPRAWMWALGGAVAVVVLLPALWRWWSHDPAVEAALDARSAVAGQVTPHSSATPADAASSVAAAPATVPEPSGTPTPAEAAKSPPVAQEKPHTPAHTPTKAAAAGKAASAARSDAATPPRAGAGASAQSAVAAQSPQTSRAASTPAAPPASAPEPRLRTLTEFPEDLRRNVPTLSFGGSVYSEIAAQRMVILNGQVLREGDPVTEELQLEQIRPRSAVLRLRGQRFEMPF